MVGSKVGTSAIVLAKTTRWMKREVQRFSVDAFVAAG